MKQTRRQIIKSLTGIVAGVSTVGSSTGQTVSFDSSITSQNQSISYANTTHTKDMNESTYLALPGFSFSSLLINLPQLSNNIGSSPTIFIDSLDWERLKHQVVKRQNKQSKQLGMAYGELRRRGVVKTINYKTYYSQNKQNENIKQSQEMLSSVPEHQNRRAARTAAGGFLRYGIGEYQNGFREFLDNLTRYTNHRQSVERQNGKMDSGLGDPMSWNEGVINQYSAALAVRHQLSQELGREVCCLGQGEFSSIGMILDAAESKTHPRTLSNQFHNFEEIDTSDTSKTRDVLNKISSIAQEVADVENNHYFTLGPRLALPQHTGLFKRARSQIRFNRDVKTVSKETREILSFLDAEAEDNRSVEFLEAEVDWLIEENDFNSNDKARIREQLESEVALSNHSRDLKDLADSDRFSSASVYLAASIKMDPQYQYDKNEVYHKAIDLKRELEPITVTNEEVENFKNRGGFRRAEDGRDWYQEIDRNHASA